MELIFKYGMLSLQVPDLQLKRIWPKFFYELIYKPSYCLESRKNNLIYKIIFLFYPQTLNIICFVEKNDTFLRFCLCIFESDTVKSDCPVQIFRKIMKDLIQTVDLPY